MKILHAHQRHSEPPPHYRSFIEEMQRFATEKGISWDEPGQWDVRRLTGGPERIAQNIGNFEVMDATRDSVLKAGVPNSKVPHVGQLPTVAQDFIKAVAVSKAKSGRKSQTVKAYALATRHLMSTTGKMPWELSSEEFERIVSLLGERSKLRELLASVARTINESLLSHNCPIIIRPSVRAVDSPLVSLSERKDGQKLPDSDALFELTRIVFQETPRTHRDLLCFCAIQIMILTGLRVNEVLMLCRDCIIWREYTDVVSGRPAGEVGGITKSMGLRYFREKTKRTATDLVEGIQWIPERFQMLVQAAVERVGTATETLREIIRAQHLASTDYPGSDLRTFKTIDGSSLDTSHLLFLVETNKPGVPNLSAGEARVSPLLDTNLTRRLGRSRPHESTRSFFEAYGQTKNAKALSLKSHSLRHLMNTEFFRLNVPDTAITHQFGRLSVAQSYEYDHRTLAERLNFVKLPAAAEQTVQKGSMQELVAKMVVSGVVAGSHLAESFAKIQREHGDDAAFQYLVANSDGFHVTPYGFCTNSFSVNPCARHLKCFDNCRHFAASGSFEHRVSLEGLREKLSTMRDMANARPALSVGRKNQIANVERLLHGVEKALTAQPSTLIFPEGSDYSASSKDVFS